MDWVWIWYCVTSLKSWRDRCLEHEEKLKFVRRKRRAYRCFQPACIGTLWPLCTSATFHTVTTNQRAFLANLNLTESVKCSWCVRSSGCCASFILTQRNIPEERRPHLHHGRSLESCKLPLPANTELICFCTVTYTLSHVPWWWCLKRPETAVFRTQSRIQKTWNEFGYNFGLDAGTRE